MKYIDKFLNKLEVTGFPLVNKQRKLTGYVNVKQISRYLIEGDINYLNTSYDNIIKTLGAKEILRFDENIEGNILAAAYKSETFVNRVKLTKDNIILIALLPLLTFFKILVSKALTNTFNIKAITAPTIKGENKLKIVATDEKNNKTTTTFTIVK